MNLGNWGKCKRVLKKPPSCPPSGVEPHLYLPMYSTAGVSSGH